MEDPMNWLTLDFWKGITQRTIHWAIVAIPKVLIILVLAFVLLKMLDFLSDHVAKSVGKDDDPKDAVAAREREKRTETLIGIVKKAGSITIWSLVLILLLMQVGVDVAPLIAGAGVIGLAVGFGAQELVRDVITGFFMLLENHVRNGDVAIINGTGGLVEAIGLRTIRLRDMAGTVHIFQNGKISTLSNMTKDWSAMVFDLGVAYKENTDKVVEVVKRVGDELKSDPEFGPKILEDMEIFGVDSFGDNAVIVKARIKTEPIQQWTVGREFNRRIKMAFDAEGIEIPFPHRTIYFGEASPPFQISSTNKA